MGQAHNFKYERVADKKRLKYIIDAVLKSFNKPAKVLEIGCGNGIISYNLAMRGHIVLGTDISEAAIQKAQSFNDLDNLEFKVINAKDLDKIQEKYDVIICSEVLEHLERPEELLTILRNYIDISGLLIVTVPNGIGPRELLVTRPLIFIRERIPFMHKLIMNIKKLLGYKGKTIQSDADDLEHVQFFKFGDLRKLARQAGFKITHIGKSNFIDDVFPISALSRKFVSIQKLDSKIANILPVFMVGGFFTSWKKIQ